MENESTLKDEGLQIEIPYDLFQYLSSEGCNIDTLCRICLSETSTELYPLISANSGALQEMFTSFTAIQVLPEDGLPSNVCDVCRTQISNCYEFKSLCLKADFTLKSLLKGEFVKNDASAPKVEDVPRDNLIGKADVIKEEQETTAVSKEIKLESIAKEECDENIVEDVQYLEDLRDSDSEALYIVQKSKNNKLECTKGLPIDSKPKTKNNFNKKKNKKQLYKCRDCSKKFKNSKALQEHISRSHGTDAHTQSHSCAQCSQLYQSAHDLQLHLPIHEAGPVWKCVQCAKEFKGRSMFRRHIKRHMDNKQYSCSVCHKPFAELYALKRHTWVHTGQRLQKPHHCTLCDKRYGVQYSCSVCHKPFAELYALKRHTWVHTGQRLQKPHHCTLCDKRYSDSSQLSAHMSRHLGVRPCVCSECGKAFPTERLLTSHRRVHGGLKPYQCKFCDKRFRHESTRNTHARTHTGERPYVCAACGKRFIQSSNLTLHMRTHTGERPYACTTCGAKFSSGSTLKSHIRRHTGDKPYSCKICGKRFARADLRTHMFTHSGERPHACAVCKRRFATATRLREHERVHTGERPFECSMCCEKFASKAHLVKHVKSHQVTKRIIDNILNNRENSAPEGANNVVLDINHDDNNVTGEIIITDGVLDGQTIIPGALCLTTSDTNADLNLVTVDGSEVHIASAIEGQTLKLYQVDQSMVQIHSSVGQVTISKMITSKMTANF